MNSGIEYKHQKPRKNLVFLLDKAQITLDALRTTDKENIINAIHFLEEFPSCSSIQIHLLKSMPNYFTVQAGIYRIIFEFKSGEIIINEIVNYDRIKFLYGS